MVSPQPRMTSPDLNANIIYSPKAGEKRAKQIDKLIRKSTRSNDGNFFGDKKVKTKGRKHFVAKVTVDDNVAQIMEYPLSHYTGTDTSQN